MGVSRRRGRARGREADSPLSVEPQMQIHNERRVLNELDGVVCGGLQGRGCEATRLVRYFGSRSAVMFKGPDMVGGKS